MKCDYPYLGAQLLINCQPLNYPAASTDVCRPSPPGPGVHDPPVAPPAAPPRRATCFLEALANSLFDQIENKAAPCQGGERAFRKGRAGVAELGGGGWRVI